MDCFGVFVKYWEPGKVKTRLAATLGDEATAEIYRQFVLTLIRRFSRTGDERVLCFAPDDRAAAFREVAGSDWFVKPQSSGNLGERMIGFFDSHFRNGAERVVLIGSDSPTMPTEHVESAFRLLSETDVVLGPTEDGGYYLIGASRDVAGIFEEIDWSTPQVWDQTIARLCELQLSYESLPQWYDVDERADLLRLRDELSGFPSDDSTFDELLTAINRVL